MEDRDTISTRVRHYWSRSRLNNDHVISAIKGLFLMLLISLPLSLTWSLRGTHHNSPNAPERVSYCDPRPPQGDIPLKTLYIIPERVWHRMTRFFDAIRDAAAAGELGPAQEDNPYHISESMWADGTEELHVDWAYTPGNLRDSWTARWVLVGYYRRHEPAALFQVKRARDRDSNMLFAGYEILVALHVAGPRWRLHPQGAEEAVQHVLNRLK